MTWQLDQFNGKDVVFVGAGQGRAMRGLQSFLQAHAQLASFTGVDKQDGDEPLQFLLDYDQSSTIFIKNEAIPGSSMPVPYCTAMQIFFELVEQRGATTIGITGTKGKSTTASLVAHALQSVGKPVVLAGNIGVSPFDGLQTADADTIFVLELSSYQLSDLQVSPHISACTNLYNDHSDWHGSLENYWQAKRNIMRFAKANDLFVYNPDFSTLQQWADEAQCRTIAIDPTAELDLSNSQLFGDHNILNALIAREVCRACNVDDEQFAAALQTFTPLRHRMQLVATKQDIVYVDDAIGMTPESTLAGLRAITERFGPIGCLLLGGQNRGYDFTALMAYVAERTIPAIVLFPDTTDAIKSAMPAHYQPTILEADNMSDAVKFASTAAPKNSVVLLSTAAPSYSLWRDFEDKGDQFQAAVNAL